VPRLASLSAPPRGVLQPPSAGPFRCPHRSTRDRPNRRENDLSSATPSTASAH
jgi:hypothetical protein